MSLFGGKKAEKITVSINTNPPKLTDKEFELFKDYIYNKAGISLTPLKKSLVENRLSKKIRVLKLKSYLDYYKKITSDVSKKETQVLIDLLTTNETYFFREPAHFTYLKDELLPKVDKRNSFSLWCAASSSGEEPYTLAMMLSEGLGSYSDWKITATDINTEVLETAKAGKYTLNEKDAIPDALLKKYCMQDNQENGGGISIVKGLKNRVHYERLNLMDNWGPNFNNFDIVFIRNVMIYFNTETRISLVNRIADRVKMGGYLFISHTETLNSLTDRFKIVHPSVYVRIK